MKREKIIPLTANCNDMHVLYGVSCFFDDRRWHLKEIKFDTLVLTTEPDEAQTFVDRPGAQNRLNDICYFLLEKMEQEYAWWKDGDNVCVPRCMNVGLDIFMYKGDSKWEELPGDLFPVKHGKELNRMSGELDHFHEKISSPSISEANSLRRQRQSGDGYVLLLCDHEKYGKAFNFRTAVKLLVDGYLVARRGWVSKQRNSNKFLFKDQVKASRCAMESDLYEYWPLPIESYNHAMLTKEDVNASDWLQVKSSRRPMVMRPDAGGWAPKGDKYKYWFDKYMEHNVEH